MSVDDPQPRWSKNVPWCANERCQLHDGKRCEATGFPPGSICEPAVVKLSRDHDAAQQRIKTLRNLLAQVLPMRAVVDAAFTEMEKP